MNFRDISGVDTANGGRGRVVDGAVFYGWPLIGLRWGGSTDLHAGQDTDGVARSCIG